MILALSKNGTSNKTFCPSRSVIEGLRYLKFIVRKIALKEVGPCVMNKS
jgi:hypothetical protein